MCVWVWFVVTIHSFAGEAGAQVWALRLTTSETSSDEDVQQHQNQQFQFHMCSGDLPARTCLLWLLVVLVDLTDSSRTPVHDFINTPIFHFLPPDWSLPCVCSYLRRCRQLASKLHRGSFSSILFSFWWRSLTILPPALICCISPTTLSTVSGKSKSEQLIWYLKHAPPEITIFCNCLLMRCWRESRKDGKIKKRQTDEVKRSERLSCGCVHVGVSESLGRLIAFLG